MAKLCCPDNGYDGIDAYIEMGDCICPCHFCKSCGLRKVAPDSSVYDWTKVCCRGNHGGEKS